MKELDITIIKNTQRETATLGIDRATSTLSITFTDGTKKTYSVAYDVTMSEPDAELVRIFDYEENNLTNDINEQIAYRNKWAESLQTR
ncbi:hypothetical protein AO284_37120 [Pseudomonas sp. NZIPFR-PS2]|nr:hypothetical protein AO284_37120 [Pseudomonas sp. NZIPFR-PS2]